MSINRILKNKDRVLQMLVKTNRTPDIKTPKQTEEKLNLYRQIIANSNDAIAILDTNGYYIEQNSAHRALLGYADEELQGKTPAIHAGNDFCVSFFDQLIKQGSYRGEISSRAKSGKLIYLEVSSFVVYNDVGQPICYVGIKRDITQRKQIELELLKSKEAAERVSRSKSEFLANMSHELRTPLNAILGLSQVLVQGIFGELNAKQMEYVSSIYSSGEHLLSLINDILDLSKVEAGKEELLLMPIAVSELCQYCLCLVRERAFKKGIVLTIQIDSEVDCCIGDERRLKQMLLNLLSNAIEFTTVGKVELIVRKVAGSIAFTVADTGIGIATEDIPSLFQPFSQVDKNLNRQHEGTGLGLVLTRKLARLHGGDVTVQSILGKGSQFTLFLPDSQQVETNNIDPKYSPQILYHSLAEESDRQAEPKNHSLV